MSLDYFDILRLAENARDARKLAAKMRADKRTEIRTISGEQFYAQVNGRTPPHKVLFATYGTLPGARSASGPQHNAVRVKFAPSGIMETLVREAAARHASFKARAFRKSA